MLLAALERMDHHLTAAVVSSEPAFLHQVLSRTVNGTTVRAAMSPPSAKKDSHVHAASTLAPGRGA